MALNFKMDGYIRSELIENFRGSVEKLFVKQRLGSIKRVYELVSELDKTSPEKHLAREMLLDICMKQIWEISEPKWKRSDNERRFMEILDLYCEKK